jgi:hypothetical protein
MEKDRDSRSLGFAILQYSSAPVLQILNSFMEDSICFYQKLRNITEN